MKLTLKPSLFPPGGFKYTDPDGVTFTGIDLPGLVQSVTAYRNLRGQPITDVEQLILSQLCARTPALCNSTTPAFDGKTLALYVAHDVHQTARVKDTLSTDEDRAAVRFVACMGCPQNVDWQAGCPTCQKSVAKILPQVLIPRAQIKGSGNRSCLLARDCLALAVYKDNPAPLPTAPETCWRKL